MASEKGKKMVFNGVAIGRDIFDPTNPEFPGPGQYEVSNGEESNSLRYGSLSKVDKSSLKRNVLETGTFSNGEKSEAGTQGRVASRSGSVGVNESRSGRVRMERKAAIPKEATRQFRIDSEGRDAKAEAELKAMKNKLYEEQEKVKKLTREIGELESKYEKKLEIKDQEVKKLTLKADSLNEKIITSREENKKIQAEFESLGKEGKELSREMERKHSDAMKKAGESAIKFSEQQKKAMQLETQLNELKESSTKREKEYIMKLDEYKKDLEAKKELVENITKELEEMNEKSKTLQETMGTEAEAKHQLLTLKTKAEIENLNKELSQVREEKEALLEQVAKLEALQAELKAQNEKSIEEAARNLASANEEVARLKQQNKELSEKCEEKEAQNAAQAAKIDASHTEQLDDLHKQLAVVSEDLAQAELQINELGEAAKKTEEQHQIHTKEMSAKHSKQIESLNKQIQSLKDEVSDQLSSYSSKSDEYEQSIKRKDQEIVEMNRQVEAMNEQSKSFVNKLMAKEDENNNLSDTIRKMTEEHVNKFAELNKTIELLKNQLDEQKQSFEKQLKEDSEAFQTLNSKYVQSVADLGASESIIDSKKKQVSKYRDQNKHLNDIIRSIKDKVATTKTIYHELQGNPKLQLVDSDLSTLSDHLDEIASQVDDIISEQSITFD
ncbi:hypothetical protein AX774_g2702 [Zancudomyces culisetae]|uniref:Uncharacterized protein n=1 Tax=Zancudomyces culisetae TaxID=1213189 RepID=A0A1R1PS14_ZANCU|nr:hypothetical protein AX774_g2702 [Zancudomyces culisetae]|eukprot:OMH83776.1 hypothetical protein AX774_g2702 [Zancudomyces culisetae]